MLKSPMETLTSNFSVRNPMKVSLALRALPEFARGREVDGGEEWLWIVSQYSMGRSEPKAVAAVRLIGCSLQVGCPNEHTQRAMKILLECILGGELISSRVQNQRLTLSVEAE